ncbi:MAG: hypothetical protein JRD93_07465 [Deltaproteobacteria bacterium]|nr:hypothetical protein [Deltaproteobacteria bacterium]
MRYFFVETLGKLGNPNLCILSRPPDGLGVKSYRMAKGKKIGVHYPKDAIIYMDDEHPGIKIESLIGNTKGYLIVSREMKECIEEHCTFCEIEYLPFTLYNHKKRVHSQDYFIINPIGTFDCLNLKASQIEYLDGEVVGIDNFVVDPRKLEKPPALFRIKEDPRRYVINEELAKAFEEKGFTNVLLKEIGQSTK